MSQVFKLKPFVIAFAGITLTSTATFAAEFDFIEPPMVSIPAGEFSMGSDRGEENARPIRRVSISAFQMGKYEVTVAEFKKFIKATDYEMPSNCYQHVLGGPTEVLAAWDTNVYNFSDYHPVVCLPQQAAVDYATWLTDQTGKHYRLPSEAEWEYTLRAGTSTRYFFGDEQAASKACQYGNVSDWYAADKSAEIFPGAYVRDIEQCSDNEATLAMVGLYQANPFGVHDLMGNAMEYLADCYVDSYKDAPVDGSQVIIDACDSFVARGGSWHWFPWHSSERSYITNDFLGAIEGFRLVLDTEGKELPSQKGDTEFVQKLTLAQDKVKLKHAKNPAYPNKPQGLEVVEAKRSKVTLSWQGNSEVFLSGYTVYRQDPLTNKKMAISTVIKDTHFIDTSPLAHNARYSVVALNGTTQSQSSEAVDSGSSMVHTLPIKIQGEAFNFAHGADVRDSTMEPDNDKIFSSLGDKKASYQIRVARGGKFQLDARVFHSGEAQKFELWLGDQKLAAPKLEGERGWKTVNNIVIELPQGIHTLTVEGEQPMFAVNWLDVKAI